VGEADWSWDFSFVPSRCPSASLNDDFIDIGFFQQFPANRIETGSAERPWTQTADVSSIDMQNALDH